MGDNYSYSIESYSWITNIGDTIFKLNPLLKSYGYQFVFVRLEDLEKKFSNLFGFPHNYESESLCTLNRFDKEVKWDQKGNLQEAIEKVRNEKLSQGFKREDIESTISQEFYDLLMHNVQGGQEIVQSHGVIFLNRIENNRRIVVNRRFTCEDELKVAGEMQEFENHLIRCMRLFKNGDVASRAWFQVATEKRNITLRFTPAPFLTGGKKFILDDNDMPLFQQLLYEKFKPNHLTELALQTFELAYLNHDHKSRYLNFMICLESLFNRNAAEISHTISRHVAIILSNSETEFNDNYSLVKKLYSYRNDIIHGKKLSFNLTDKTEELQEIVRRSINFCLKLDFTKEQLFTYLNSKGF